MKTCKCGTPFEPITKPNSTIKTKHCVACLVKKGKQAEKKQWNKEKKKIKEKLKRLPDYKEDARRAFQKWVRLRDKDLPCVSCGRTEAKQWDGGHFLKAEIYSGLIFCEDNCHKQCSYCNDYLRGNWAEYQEGLIKRIGEERVRWLEENKDRLRNYKYTKDELKEIKKVYADKIKQLNQTL